MRLIASVILFFWLSPVLADCYGIITLPLSMPKFQQDGLRWIGKVGGSGRSDSTCTSPTQTRYDFRYNIIENTATCTNELTKKCIKLLCPQLRLL